MGGLDESGSPPPKRVKLLAQAAAEGPLRDKVSDESPDIIMPEPYSISTVSSMLSSPTAFTSASEEIEPLLGPTGLIRKVEFVRLITQSLYSLGYKNAAALLQEESGIALKSEAFAEFQKLILERRWDDSIIALRKLEALDSQTFNAAASLVLRQKFVECIRKGDVFEAMNILRAEILPLVTEKEKVQELAACLVCPSKIDQISRVNGNASKNAPELALLEQLQGVISPAVMMPEKRLEILLEQALDIQVKNCVQHNIPHQPLSLFKDHECGQSELPTQTLQVLEGHRNEVWFLRFSHNGKFLVSTSKDCRANIWEILHQEVRLKYTLSGHEQPVCMAAWSPNDRLLLTCGTEENIKLWNVESGECKCTIGFPNSKFTSCAWFPDGKRFVSCTFEKRLYICDIAGKELESWDVSKDKQICNLAVSHDGLYIIYSYHKNIIFLNMESSEEHTICEEESVTSLSFSCDGRYLLVNLLANKIHLWDISSDSKMVSRYRGHRQTRFVIRSCFGGSDESFIASGSEDTQVYIWHRAKCELLEVLPGHSGSVNCVSWNPTNPCMLASASDDGTIRIWGPEKCSMASNHVKS